MIFKKKKYSFHFITMFALFVYMSMIFAFTVSQVMSKGKSWSQSLNSGITVELPLNGNLKESIKDIRKISGVKIARAMDSERKDEILETWLEGVDTSRMPIVEIIEVKIANQEHSEKIKNQIERKIRGAKVYSNTNWGEDIMNISKAIFYMCVFLLFMIVGISLILINFMIKSLLNSYAREINILHLNGASDVFISAMLQRNIFLQAVQASFLGVLFANITEFILSRFFNLNYIIDWSLLINSCLIILLVAIICSMFAKFNVEKELRK